MRKDVWCDSISKHTHLLPRTFPKALLQSRKPWNEAFILFIFRRSTIMLSSNPRCTNNFCWEKNVSIEEPKQVYVCHKHYSWSNATKLCHEVSVTGFVLSATWPGSGAWGHASVQGDREQTAKHRQHNLRARDPHPHRQEKHVQGRVKGQRVPTAHPAAGRVKVSSSWARPRAEVCRPAETWPRSCRVTRHGSAWTQASAPSSDAELSLLLVWGAWNTGCVTFLRRC